MSKPEVDNNEHFYMENGYLVFTEQYHLDKGFCCGNGCRHCPYEYESVPEPRKSELLNSKSKSGLNKDN